MPIATLPPRGCFTNGFYERIDATFDIIKRFPDGSPLAGAANPRLKGLRRIYVSQLKTYVIYYLHHTDIENVRVFHSARDRESLLKDQP